MKPIASGDPLKLFLLPNQLKAIPLDRWKREYPGVSIYQMALKIEERPILLFDATKANDGA